MPAKIDFSTLTLMDTLDLAHLIEVEAFDRYTLFATQIGSGFSNDAGSVFQSMAENEKKHGDELAERRKDTVRRRAGKGQTGRHLRCGGP